MQNFNKKQEIQVLLACTVGSYLSSFVVAAIQGWKAHKINKKQPEDYEVFSALISKSKDIKKSDEDLAYRWQRSVMNNLENIPYSLMIFWGSYLATDGSDQSISNLIRYSCISFTVSRIAFSLAFAYGKQPYRSISFAIAFFSVITCGFTCISQSFK